MKLGGNVTNYVWLTGKSCGVTSIFTDDVEVIVLYATIEVK